jgi:hypothetical protein
MVVSHSFTGEHIEHRGDEKADADCDHHDIKHGGSPFRALQIAATNRQRRLRKTSETEDNVAATPSTVLGRAPRRRNRAGIN